LLCGAAPPRHKAISDKVYFLQSSETLRMGDTDTSLQETDRQKTANLPYLFSADIVLGLEIR
jgi:hypothetical protein